MRFTLTYEGELLSKGTAEHKEHIRQALHPQLRELWTHDPLTIYPQFLSASPSEGTPSVLTAVG